MVHKLEQTDRLGHRHGRELVLGLPGELADLADLAPVLGVDEVALQVVDPIQGHQGARLRFCQAALGVGEQLLGEFDDRAVGAAVLLAGST